MNVLIDTSLLIQAQRRPESPEARELAELLIDGDASVTGAVIMEFLRGARSDSEMAFLVSRMTSINYLEMDRQAWILAGRISNRLSRSGQTLSDFDVAIAAAAIRHDVPLYTLDKGFQRIPELTLYQPSSG